MGTRTGRNAVNSSDLPSPPGFSASINQIHDPSRQSDSSLRAKRLWDMALGPIKQVPMNLFIMYMSGNAISIFPIMMVIMMAVRPFKTLFSINSTFKALDANESAMANFGRNVSTFWVTWSTLHWLFTNVKVWDYFLPMRQIG